MAQYLSNFKDMVEFDDKFVDATDKLRVTNPQSLIDTDFEYGTQGTKWENLTLINNKPFSYQSAAPIANVSAIEMPQFSRTVTVTLSSGVAPPNGTPITVQDTFLSIANGNFIIDSGGGTNQFSYTGRVLNTTSVTNILDLYKTAIYQGILYINSSIGGAPAMSYDGNKVTVVTTVPHGLSIGNEIAVSGVTTDGTNAPDGAHIVATVQNSNTFDYYVLDEPTGTLNTTNCRLYVRPQGQFLHRPLDGGVIFTSNGNANFETAIRQTRRYFRYQSGKSIQMSSGSVLKPNLQIDQIRANGTTITVQTKEQHNIQPGTKVRVFGANEPPYNGEFTITSITGYNTFTYETYIEPAQPVASGNYSMAVLEWYGSANRLGMFDDQNGMFFEFDGQKVWTVRRSSTYQIAGKISVNPGSEIVTQTDPAFPTIFSKQLIPGDRIVIRGQSYRVVSITSDQQLTITPAYKGDVTQYAVITKTIDLRIPQEEWNIDTMDGNGPSGYDLDLSKMQMFYIDYTWYGAGYIRYGLRGPDGQVMYCNKIINNNVNDQAYMRTGNVPARYESSTDPKYTFATQGIGTQDTEILVQSTEGFPEEGTILVRNATTYEYINYTSKTDTSFRNLTRAQQGAQDLQLIMPAYTNLARVSTISGLQVGQRVIGAAVPDGTFVSEIITNEDNTYDIRLSQAVTTADPLVDVAPMGAVASQVFQYLSTNPITVEMAWPTYGPSVSHWGTSVIMDGRFDDDKSLIFTYGQTNAVTLGGGQTRALLSIRVAPSVDNSISAFFGQRELLNRMQLVLRELGFVASSSNAYILVRAILNGRPSIQRPWTNAVGDAVNVANSSLSQICDLSPVSATVIGGETVGGFFVQGRSASLDLSKLRDLGNSILGGGGLYSNEEIYPDGPDTLTIIATNISGTTTSVFTRLSWTEAQA